MTLKMIPPIYRSLHKWYCMGFLIFYNLIWNTCDNLTDRRKDKAYHRDMWKKKDVWFSCMRVSILKLRYKTPHELTLLSSLGQETGLARGGFLIVFIQEEPFHSKETTQKQPLRLTVNSSNVAKSRFIFVIFTVNEGEKQALQNLGLCVRFYTWFYTSLCRSVRPYCLCPSTRDVCDRDEPCLINIAKWWSDKT